MIKLITWQPPTMLNEKGIRKKVFIAKPPSMAGDSDEYDDEDDDGDESDDSTSAALALLGMDNHDQSSFGRVRQLMIGHSVEYLQPDDTW